MDERTLNILARALKWEARYRKREHLDGKGLFLPRVDGFDPDFSEALTHLGINGGRLLEIGAGLGDQARHFSRLGFRVTATDVSHTAVEHAKRAAADAGYDVEFIADNILMSALSGCYDLIVDRGCYSLFCEDWMRKEYCRKVRGLLAPGGVFFLKTDKQKTVINELTEGFRIVYSRDTRYHEEKGPKAEFHVLRALADEDP